MQIKYMHGEKTKQKNLMKFLSRDGEHCVTLYLLYMFCMALTCSISPEGEEPRWYSVHELSRRGQLWMQTGGETPSSTWIKQTLGLEK